MKLRSSTKFHFENVDVNDLDEDETVYSLDEDETVYSLEADDSLIEDNKIWFVVLIMALFIINYLYGSITSNSTTSNSTTDVIYW
jgi:hypothetical protein